MMNHSQPLDALEEEEESLRYLMEKDIKCIEKFSEKTIISPNAVFYRPKST
jgi:hypothetical protein